MKVFVATLILSLFAGSYAFHSVRPLPPNVMDTSFLSKVGGKKKASFSQLTSLMGQLRDVSQVTDFLSEQLENVEAVRQQKLAIIQSDRAAYNVEVEVRGQAIQEGEASAEASQTALTSCTNQQALAQDRNQRASASLDKFQTKLANLIAGRSAQHKQNQKHVELLEDFLGKVTQLNQLLDNYEAAGSSPAEDALFIQTTNKLLKNALRTGQSSLISKLYNKLIQMRSKQEVDEDDLSEIRQLLVQMSDLASNQIDEINNQDAEQQSVFEQNQSAIQNVIDVLTAQVVQTAAFIQTATICIEQETNILALSNDKVSRNTQLLAVAEELHQATEQEWAISESSRRTEIGIINALLSAVKRLEQEYEANVGPQVGDLVNLKML